MKKIINLLNKVKHFTKFNLRFVEIDCPIRNTKKTEDTAIEWIESLNDEFVCDYCHKFREIPKNSRLYNLLKHSVIVGRPDLYVYDKKNIDDFFLIEVKTGKDGLRKEQLSWIITFDYVKILVLYINDIN